jgi:LPXTG-motif cell wall-anchored protein
MKEIDPITRQIARLREFHATDQRGQIGEFLRRFIEDPLKPKTDTGQVRVNRVLVLLGITALLAGGTFLFFRFVQL